MPRRRSPLLVPGVTIAGIVVGFAAYAAGAPEWLAIALALSGPGLGLGLLFGRHRERVWSVLQSVRYELGFLIVVVLLAIPAVWREWARPEAVDLVAAPEHNFTDVLAELYPERGEAQYLKAVQAGICLNTPAGRLPDICKQYENVDLRKEVRRRFDVVIRSGIKNREEYSYEYLNMLIQLDADDAEIDRAYDLWRRHFPYSKLPDPRRARDGMPSRN